jgi:hypothetical protein
VRRRTPGERLYWLVDLLMADQLPLRDFLREFEWTFTNEVGTGDLTVLEERHFRELFNVVSRYATPEERLQEPAPGQTTEEDVRAAAQRAKALLRHRLV